MAGKRSSVEWRTVAIVDQGEAENQRDRPEGKKQQQRHRPEVAEQSIALLCVTTGRRQAAPHGPGGAIKRPRQPELPGHTPGKDDGFKGLPQHRQDEENAASHANKVPQRPCLSYADIRLQGNRKSFICARAKANPKTTAKP